MREKENWKDISLGGNIYQTGNAKTFITGDWRTIRPIWITEKCTQCMLCFPSCPDSSIPSDESGKRTDFDYEHCKGCGICACVCPFEAIDMASEGKEESK